MKSMLHDYAERYYKQQEHKTQEEDEQRSIRNPVVFLFLGDYVTEALDTIYRINENRWHNSSGVMYFHAYQSGETVERGNVVSVKLPETETERKSIRKDVYEQFTLDEDKLLELNKSFRKISNKIAEYGRLYSSRQKVNLSVVTRIDDPANVVIQELTLLLKTVLLDSFKSVEVDFYGLIKEQTEGDGFAYSASLGISFLKELDIYQRQDYAFKKPLQVTEDYLKLPVTHQGGPLYDIAYLLSDKDENGLFSQGAAKNNYEMISQINLLKNQKMITENNENSESYNNAQFRKNIQANNERNVYATAGFSNVKRPNKIIALYAAYHFSEYYQTEMKEAANQPIERIIELFDLTTSAIHKTVMDHIPSKEKIEDMKELLWNQSTYNQVKRLSIRDAEHHLFEGVAEDFFNENVVKATESSLKAFDIQSKVERHIEQILSHKHYGVFSAYAWSSDKEEFENVRGELRKMIISSEKQLEELVGMLEQAYQQNVDASNFQKTYLPFSDKRNLRTFISYLFNSVYGIKYDINVTRCKIEYLKKYELHLEEKHEYLIPKVQLMQEVHSSVKEAALKSLHQADDYIGKNVREYYEGIVKRIMNRLEQKWGEGFFVEERFLGKVLSLLEDGSSAFLKRLLELCNKEILTQEEFNKTFEDELFERSNVKTDYENRDVLPREEIFKQLFKRLDQYSAVQIEVYNFTQKHRYEEKYFFGDYTSDFLKYALDRENQSRHYKVGCVHEKKTSGIEKLRIMGGFQIDDLMYYRNNLKYYDAYIENGFMLHGMENLSYMMGEKDAYEKI